jgi:hypothetical protein
MESEKSEELTKKKRYKQKNAEQMQSDFKAFQLATAE